MFGIVFVVGPKPVGRHGHDIESGVFVIRFLRLDEDKLGGIAG